jgi:hypothetical protein
MLPGEVVRATFQKVGPLKMAMAEPMTVMDIWQMKDIMRWRVCYLEWLEGFGRGFATDTEWQTPKTLLVPQIMSIEAVTRRVQDQLRPIYPAQS